MQHRFTTKLLAAAKKLRVHTVIETNGYFGDRLSDADLENIDLVMLVLVPGLTDDPAIAGGIAEFASGLGNVERVDVLPFHQMGRYKWQALGLQYSLDHAEPPSEGVIERAVAAFRARGLKAH